jgi:ABC-type sugar transport system ATPase subunit
MQPFQYGAMVDSDTIVSMEDLTKKFGSIVALENVDLHLRKGEILGLAGDNGAGKSTLIKCLSGAIQPDNGTIKIRGEEVTLQNPRQAQRYGVETTFQDLALVEELSVPQNIFLGRERKTKFGRLKKSEMREKANDLLEQLDINISPESEIRELSGGEQQLVAISRTMLSNPDILIMDEPTSALSVEGAEKVLNLIERLRNEGVSIILITHNVEYMRRVTDRIQVLHTGSNVGTIDAEEVTREQVVNLMVGGDRKSTPLTNQTATGETA